MSVARSRISTYLLHLLASLLSCCSAVRPLKHDGSPCAGFEDVLRAYEALIPLVTLHGPTDFAPAIRKAIELVKATKQYHILLIIADGILSDQEKTARAIVEASSYPLVSS